MKRTLFIRSGLAMAVLPVLAFASCHSAGKPSGAQAKADNGAKNGIYYASADRLFEEETPFDVRWKVVHKPMEDSFDPSTNIDNRQLAFARCDRCHECGFHRAFDMDHYGSKAWKPLLKGDQWTNAIYRMQDKPNAFLNPQIMERIYLFLRDETTVGYNMSEDVKNAVKVEVDEHGNPIKHERTQTPKHITSLPTP